MTEVKENKTVENEPIKTENGVFLDEKLDSLDKNTENTKKSNVSIEKKIEYVIETKKEKEERIQREITATNKKIWLEMFGKTMGSYAEVNKRTDTPKSTFYYWFNHDEEFKNQIIKVLRNNMDDMEDILVLKAKSGNMQALIKWLECNHPKYGKTVKVETYTGNKTYEDLLADFEKEINEEINEDENNNQKQQESGLGNGGETFGDRDWETIFRVITF